MDAPRSEIEAPSSMAYVEEALTHVWKLFSYSERQDNWSKFHATYEL